MTDDNGSRLRGAAENVWALIIARFIIPVAVVLVGGLGTWALNSLTHSNESIWVKLTELQSSVSQIHEDNSNLHIFLSQITARRDQELGAIHLELEDHEARLREAELRRHR